MKEATASGGGNSDSWSQVGAHPGIRDPRSARPDDWPPPVNALIIATCALVTIVALAAAWTAPPIEEIEQWRRWTTEDGAWSFEYPSGWSVQEFPGPGGRTQLMVLRSRWVRIHLIADPDIARLTRNHRGYRSRAGSEYTAVERAHAQTAAIWDILLGEIDDGRPGRTTIGNHRAVWSEFRYRGGHLEAGEPMSGYRATVVGDRSSVIVGAVAPTRFWRRFRPIALRMLRSITPGGGT